MDNTGTMWAATSGGMFAFRPASTDADTPFEQSFTTSEGLLTIDLTAITLDAQQTLWIGASNGMLHHYNPARNTWEYISDIDSLNTPQKQINALTVKGDTLYILSAIGVSVYRISAGEFGDTYTRFGPGASPITGNATALAIFNGRLWIGTPGGIASTPMSNMNPLAPDSWTIDNTSTGLPSNAVAGLAVLHNILYAATGAGLAEFDGTQWTTVPGSSGLNVLSVGILGGGVNPDHSMMIPVPCFATATDLWTVSLFPQFNMVNRISIGGTNFSAVAPFGTVAGTTDRGIYYSPYFGTDTIWHNYLSPGPYSNHFIGMAVDDNNTLWAVTGSQNGEGFMSFNGSSWRSYRSADYPQFGSDNFFKVSAGANNCKWVGNWGTGVVLLDGSDNVRKILRSGNGLYSALPSNIDSTFVVVGGVATDRNGTAWITDRTPPNDTALVVFRPDSSLGYITGQPTRNPNLIFNDVVIDQFGTKWFANFGRFEPVSASALYFYNESYILSGAGGHWGSVGTGNGLTSTEVWALALGRDGDLWIGSDQGISIIFDTSVPLSVAAYHPLRDQVVQTIAVDALNNKWVGTKQGVFVMSSDGTSILDHYTVQSTSGKLLDDDVASIAIDGNSGTVYFGTEKGLSSLTTPSINPARSFNGLTIYPNPYFLPSTAQLTVDGLVEGSILKITTVSGRLVRDIQTPGGRIGYWDGTDNHGALVPSGVYIVIAASADGSKVETGKIAVLRK